MNKFSDRSNSNLKSCHPDLQFLFTKVLEHSDITILCGYRGEEDQTRLFNSNKSQLKFPLSNHNQEPSMAVDVAPYPIDWEDVNGFFRLAGIVETVAKDYNIKIKWGGDWETFKDYPHWELA